MLADFGISKMFSDEAVAAARDEEHTGHIGSGVAAEAAAVGVIEADAPTEAMAEAPAGAPAPAPSRLSQMKAMPTNVSQKYVMRTVLGTQTYAAPEILRIEFALWRRAEGYTQACDVWGIALVLHILITGVHPTATFKGNWCSQVRARDVVTGRCGRRMRGEKGWGIQPKVVTPSAGSPTRQVLMTFVGTAPLDEALFEGHSPSILIMIRKMLQLKADDRCHLREVFEDPWVKGEVAGMAEITCKLPDKALLLPAQLKNLVKAKNVVNAGNAFKK